MPVKARRARLEDPVAVLNVLIDALRSPYRDIIPDKYLDEIWSSTSLFTLHAATLHGLPISSSIGGEKSKVRSQVCGPPEVPLGRFPSDGGVNEIQAPA
jgi:hypothetical protein